MAGFRKAKAEQAALKIAMYGKSGSGKTFTSLLVAEGLSQRDGKRLAFVDTERGTDFYAMPVAARKCHPEAFDFDALYSRSMTEVLDACRSLDANAYSCVVIDSMTHLWNTCIDSYGGKKTTADTIPMQAWGKIKKPYKQLMNWMLSTPMHVILCGRQGYDYAENADGELTVNGVKMKAEGETPYEPHILLNMQEQKRKDGTSTIYAFAEKDRTGVLHGQLIEWPNFDNIAKPVLALLGDKQSTVDSDSAALQDAEANAAADSKRAKESEGRRDEFLYRMKLAKTKKEVDGISKEISPAIKKEMLTEHVTELREAYQDRLSQLST